MPPNHSGDDAESTAGSSAPRATFPGSQRLRRHLRGAREALAGPIVSNAAQLYATTIVTNLLGFFFWFIAARMATQTAVGVASAIQAAALFMSVFSVFGLSTMLLSELAIDKSRTRSLVLTAGLAAAVTAAVAAAGVGVLLRTVSTELRKGLYDPIDIVLFALLSALTTLLVILDDACIGLLRGDLQLRRNAVFALSKLLILPLFIYLWPATSGIEILAAWIVGLALSLVVLLVQLSRLTRGHKWRFDFPHLIQRRQLLFGHYWLNLSIQSPRFLIPIVVTIIVSAAANAAFTVALLLVTFVNIIPIHLSTVLFALKPGDEVRLSFEVRRTMRICTVVAALAAPFFLISSWFLLGLFGPHYRIATPALMILGLTVYPLAIRTHYVAIARVRSQMSSASVRTLIGGSFEVGLAAVGGALYGLTGVALGYLTATVCEAFVFSSTVFGVLRNNPPRHIAPDH
jgi:O-antigen/teichoic acid export membrane protein